MTDKEAQRGSGVIQATQLKNGYNPGTLSPQPMLCTTLLSCLDPACQGLDNNDDVMMVMMVMIMMLMVMIRMTVAMM